MSRKAKATAEGAALRDEELETLEAIYGSDTFRVVGPGQWDLHARATEVAEDNHVSAWIQIRLGVRYPDTPPEHIMVHDGQVRGRKGGGGGRRWARRGQARGKEG